MKRKEKNKDTRDNFVHNQSSEYQIGNEPKIIFDDKQITILLLGYRNVFIIYVEDGGWSLRSQFPSIWSLEIE